MASNSKNIAELLNNGTTVSADDLDSTLDLSGKTLSLTAASVNDHVTQYVDTDVRSDIATLAFESARADNRAAFNLPNSFVDQFEDATGIDTTTNAARDASEYVSSSVTSLQTFEDLQIQMYDVRGDQTVQNWQTPVAGVNYDGDAIIGGSNNYSMWAADYTFDLSQDFDIWVFGQVDTSGIVHDFTYPAFSMLISEDTTKAVGSSPFAGSTTGGTPYGDIPATTWNTVMGSAAPSGLTSFGGYSSSGNVGIIQRDYSTQSASGGYIVRHYMNNGSSTMGWRFQNDTSTRTIYVNFLNSGNAETVRTDVSRFEISNVPTTGRFYCAGGNAAGIGSGNRYYSFSGRADLTENRSDLVSEVVNASGNFTGATQTASASVSEMSLVVMYEDAAGTTTLNTDLIGAVSADNGSNYTDVTFTAAPNLSSSIKVAKSSAVSVTAGTQLKYKLSFANQSASKKVKILGVSMLS